MTASGAQKRGERPRTVPSFTDTPRDCEVGYAKSRGIPFVLTFHKKDGTVGAPWDRESRGNRVHFDLAAFRHIAYDNPLDLRDKLKVELDAWFLEGHAP